MEMPGLCDKGAKVEKYRLAFEAYVSRDVAPSASELAREFGLHPLGIINCIDKQHWATARIVHWSAKYSADNIHLDQLAGQIQNQVCGSLQDIYRQLLPALADTVNAIVQIPLAPPTLKLGEKAARGRGKSVVTLCRSRLELAKLASQVLTNVSDCALKVGLLVPVRGKRDGLPERSAGMIDISGQVARALGQVPGVPSAPDPVPDDGPAEFEVEESQ